ncbi:MAG: cytochrome-c oxidase, cbb3-type subunit II [Bacteroidetes bacterium]|jgi:cbb3-type cytochrome c oxidase subunit II|nr:cytochrome-c oxidase, cbb3-type subunit II [Bacteroidota bacterium]
MKRFIKKDGMHRRLEGWPLLFTILVTISILIGGIVEFLPLALVPSTVHKIESVEPFTPLELAGRDIYIREGCNNCHSQMVRPFRHELERYGEYGKPGETVYERPFLWGSKRTGPDLARVGGKYPHLWHVRHMEDPRSTSPNSIMPPYDWLLRKDATLSDLPTKLRTLKALGTPYSQDEIDNAVALAEAQAQEIADEVAAQGGPDGLADKEITALVAFLQRLGTDIQQAPDATTAEAASTKETEDALAAEGDAP